MNQTVVIIGDSIVGSLSGKHPNLEVHSFPGARPLDNRIINFIQANRNNDWQAVIIMIEGNALSHWKGKPALSPETVSAPCSSDF